MKRAARLALTAPLLLAQGIYVRKVTPRLPEARGARSGERVLAGGGVREPLRLLIAGDSSAAGVGVEHQDDALAGRLVDAIARTGAAGTLRWEVIARSGADTRALLALLEANEPAAFHVAVIAVGVNDVTGARTLARWLGDLERLRALLHRLSPDALLVYSGLPPMHVFPALPRPLRGFLGERARQFDAALRQWSATHADTLYVAIPDPGDPALVADDGFHPGPGAYRVWADKLAGAIAGHGALSRTPTSATRIS